MTAKKKKPIPKSTHGGKRAKSGKKPSVMGPNPTPVRQLGRVPDNVWSILVAAAKRSGMTFTDWGVFHLLQAATRKDGE